MTRAETLCAKRGERMTHARRTVLGVVLSASEPLGAYDIMRLMDAGGGSTKPPTVYRALEFLEGLGLIHRIDSLRAYVGCSGRPHDLDAAFLICGRCGTVLEIETPAADRALREAAMARGFSVEAVVQEIRGVCPACFEVKA